MAVPLAALAAALTFAATPARGRSAAAAPHSSAHRASSDAPSLVKARAQLALVKRDPAKRRYRHHWEKAIRALSRAARGKDAPAALLEAARARYGLYRFSAVEADREEALRLAEKASRAGSREAPTFAAAIRREAGDEPPPAKVAGRPARARHPTATPTPTSAAAEQDEEASDPVLDKVLAEMSEPPEEPSASTPSAAEAAGPAHVSEVKTWSNTDYTRVAIYLSRAVSWQKEELAPDGERRRRLALDLRPALLGGKLLAHPVGGAQVERVRAAQRDPETVRVVLDLAGKDAYELFSLDDPPRLIVDVGIREAQREATAALRPHAGAEEGEEMAAGAARRHVRRVVVDAGHGGHDAGAIGPRRVREKDVTLALARRLAKRLAAAGFEVVLTRQDDRYLALEERTAIANTARGDLFVSLHCNAHPRRDRSGVETYFLNVTDDRYASRLAARENGALNPDGMARSSHTQVRRILSDLDAKASAGASRRLAQMVQREVVGRVRAHVGEVRDLGVKNALFYVLLGARMPAVLVETAFVSNRAEERRLASALYQDEVTEGVVRAVVAFAGKPPPRVAAR